MIDDSHVENQPRFRRLRHYALPVIIELVAIVIIVGALVVADAVRLGPAPPSPPTGDEQVRTRDDPILYSYGWVDQKSGIAHVPRHVNLAGTAEPAWLR